MKKILSRTVKLIKKNIFGEDVINFCGKGIVNLIDVGSVGNLPKPWKHNKRFIRHLLSFEPRPDQRNNPNITRVDSALWKSNEEKDFYVYEGRGGTGSSLFEQNYNYVKENFNNLREKGPEHLANSWLERSKLKKTEKLNCRKLDDVLNELSQPFLYHFLKIDAQGAEFEILKGCEKFLKDSCYGLHLELFKIPLYKGIKLLPEVSDYLDSMGFEMLKKFPPHGSFNSQADCMFLKRGKNNQIINVIKKIYQVNE